MADSSGRENHPLISQLREEGFRFSFFQAVRLLQQLRPEAPRIGLQGPPAREAVRFAPTLDLNFATSDVQGVRALPPDESGGMRHEIATTFLALYGAVSPLPAYYTEDLLTQDDDSLEREFLDLFHHRLLSLFYRSWEKYRYTVQFAPDGGDDFSRRLLTLLGAAPDQRSPTHPLPALRLLGLSGLLTQIPRSAASLAAALHHYFEPIEVRVDSCVLRPVEIPADQRNRLGGQNSTLGRDLSLGEHVYDRSATFRVALGPLALEEFLSFLPTGKRIPELYELVDLFNGDALDYEVELTLAEKERPRLQLSSPTAMLGWCSWLGAGEGAHSKVTFMAKGWIHGRG